MTTEAEDIQRARQFNHKVDKEMMNEGWTKKDLEWDRILADEPKRLGQLPDSLPTPIIVFSPNGAWDEDYHINGQIYTRSYSADGRLMIGSFLRRNSDGSFDGF